MADIIATRHSEFLGNEPDLTNHATSAVLTAGAGVDGNADATEHELSSSATELIPTDRDDALTELSLALQFRLDTSGGAGGGEYMSLFSQGGVFENGTFVAVGVRDDSVHSLFLYWRDEFGNLHGTEVTWDWNGLTDTGTRVMNLAALLTASAQKVWIDRTLRINLTDSLVTSGEQFCKLGGPNSFNSGDRTLAGQLLGVRVRDAAMDESDLLDLADDLEIDFPGGGGGDDLIEVVGEPIGVAESTLSVLGIVREVADAIGIAEATLHFRGIIRAVAEALGLAESSAHVETEAEPEVVTAPRRGLFLNGLNLSWLGRQEP